MVEDRDLLSPAERDSYHEQMREGGWEERQDARTEHSDTVRERTSTRGTDMSANGRSMKDMDHGQGQGQGMSDTGWERRETGRAMRDSHAQGQAMGNMDDGAAHGVGVGGSGSGHKYGPGGSGGGNRGGLGVSHGKGKKGK
jgi:hypothetical protein